MYVCGCSQMKNRLFLFNHGPNAQSSHLNATLCVHTALQLCLFPYEEKLHFMSHSLSSWCTDERTVFMDAGILPVLPWGCIEHLLLLPNVAQQSCLSCVDSSCDLLLYLCQHVCGRSSRDWSARCPLRPSCGAKVWRTSSRGPTAMLACPRISSLNRRRLRLRFRPALLSSATAHRPFRRLSAPTCPSRPTPPLSAFPHHCPPSLR